MSEFTRRKYLKKIASLGALSLISSNSKAELFCSRTPEQTEGPFYPIQDQNDKDNDLLFVNGNNRQAIGEVIILKGKVLDEACRPVAGALVEIWQACHSGKYNHPADPNSAPLDPHFQYWGRSITNSKGEYIFRTIRPGHYPATDTWMRPAHIHFKVHRRGYEELTSQLYFSDDPHNSKDRILQSLSPEERRKVIVEFSKQKGDNLGDKPREGVFNIYINSL